MMMIRNAAVLAASFVLALSVPALAQDYPLAEGEFVSVAAITVDDGHGLDYAKFLAGFWKDQEEFAKAQGWITGYEILANVNKRANEPDLFLVERFKSIPDATESAKRNKAYRDHMQRSAAQLEAESGARASYRHVMGSQLLQVMTIK